MFAGTFFPYLANNIDTKIKSFLTTAMIQTGFRLALKITADKATYCHRTRQFKGVTTVIPDAEEVIQCIFHGAPIVRAESVDKEITDVE